MKKYNKQTNVLTETTATLRYKAEVLINVCYIKAGLCVRVNGRSSLHSQERTCSCFARAQASTPVGGASPCQRCGLERSPGECRPHALRLRRSQLRRQQQHEVTSLETFWSEYAHNGYSRACLPVNASAPRSLRGATPVPALELREGVCRPAGHQETRTQRRA